VGGAGHFLRLAGREPFEDPPWPRGLLIQALVAGPVLAAVGFVFTQFISTGWPVAAALVVAGAVFLTLALVRAIIGVAWWAVSSVLPHAPVVANR
jgi:small-conductance mechanosensitive channel